MCQGGERVEDTTHSQTHRKSSVWPIHTFVIRGGRNIYQILSSDINTLSTDICFSEFSY